MAEGRAFGVLGLTTLLVVVPALLVIGLIIARGSGAVSWEFLSAMPRQSVRGCGTCCVIDLSKVRAEFPGGYEGKPLRYS